MKTSNILFLLIGGGIVYYLLTMKKKEEVVVDPKDVSKWDDNKLSKYLIECCEQKKKGITLGTHEKPEFMVAAKQEAIKRGLAIPKCAQSSIDNINQSFQCPKCKQSPCQCNPLRIKDMVGKPREVATGKMNSCGEGKIFYNGICIDKKKPKNARKQIGKIAPPEKSYAFPKYENPLGEGYNLQNS